MCSLSVVKTQVGSILRYELFPEPVEEVLGVELRHDPALAGLRQVVEDGASLSWRAATASGRSTRIVPRATRSTGVKPTGEDGTAGLYPGSGGSRGRPGPADSLPANCHQNCH